MEQISDLIKVYSSKSNIELYHINLEIDTYTKEAKVAFESVIKSRGGIEIVIDEYNLSLNKKAEKIRVEKEIREILKLDNSVKINYKSILSDVFNDNEKEIIVNDICSEIRDEKNDKKISFKTIIFGVLGGGISVLFSGLLWGIYLLAANSIHFIFAILFVFVNYLFITGFTKRSIKNPVVLLLVIVFAILSFFVGTIVYKNNWTIEYLISLIGF